MPFVRIVFPPSWDNAKRNVVMPARASEDLEIISGGDKGSRVMDGSDGSSEEQPKIKVIVSAATSPFQVKI